MSETHHPLSQVTLRQLEIFTATAQVGSTRGAADRVARTQSTASAALAELESTLGVQLFDRVGRRLVLNENGRLLQPHAAAALDAAGTVEALFRTAQSAPLRLASSFTIGEYLLPPMIAAWKSKNPHSQVRVAIANTHAVTETVARFEADIGFIEGARTHPDLTVHHWMNDELVVVAAHDSPHYDGRATPRQLSRATWIVREPGSGTREATDRWLIAALGQVNVELELGSNEAVKRAVACGLGLGCLSRHAVADALAQGQLTEVSLRMPRYHRSLAIVTSRVKPLGAASAQFFEQCMAQVTAASTDRS